MLDEVATTVKEGVSDVAAAPVVDAGSADTPAAPTSALDAVNAAADRLSKADSSPANTTGQPPAGVVNPSGQQPPKPEDEGIRNLRTAYESYKAKTGWSETLNKDEVTGAMSLIAEMRADPVKFFRQLQADLTGHPTYGKQLASAQPKTEEPEPKPDLYTDDGKGGRIEMYSAAAQKAWREWNDRRLTAQFEQRLSPLQDWHQSAQQEQQQRQIVEDARSTTTEVLTQMRQMPHFTKENEDKIAQRLAAIPQSVKSKVGAIAALHMAYNTFLKEEVFPSIDRSAEQRVRADFARRANAGSGVKPGSAQNGTAGVTRPTNQRELAEHMRKLAEAQSAR